MYVTIFKVLIVYSVLSLVMVLPVLVVCGGDGMSSVDADPFPPSTEPGSSPCDPDLLPCTDDDNGDACDCPPPQEEPRGQRMHNTLRCLG